VVAFTTKKNWSKFCFKIIFVVLLGKIVGLYNEFQNGRCPPLGFLNIQILVHIGPVGQYVSPCQISSNESNGCGNIKTIQFST